MMRLHRSIGLAVLLALAGLPLCHTRAQDAKPTGTGFVVDPNGYLLTAAHVVKDAAKVEVALGDKTYNATVLATDEKRDLALLAIKAKGLPALPLGNSNTVEVGEEVRAFGFPLASVLGASVKVTRGTVSGVETKDAQKVFQIDAPVNPGNSGGPLVNERGEVIGVINAKLAGEVVSNIAFAVPINYAKTMLRDNGVEFASEGAKTKLDGPALVRRVSPAVALLTVTRKGSAPTPSTPPPAPPVRPTPAPTLKTDQMKKAQTDALAELRKKGVAAPTGMVLVPGGEFELGSNEGSPDEKPQRKVTVNPFWVDAHEVTFEEFARFAQATGYKAEGNWQAEYSPDKAKHPVVNVTWNDAAAFARWAGKRLPTEAEWEMAARGVDGRPFPWGNAMDEAKANGEGQADGFKESAPVGAFKAGASPWSALDMAGNVWEWCSDAYAPYDNSQSEIGLCKVIRGGSFMSSEKALRCAERAALLPTVALNHVGFRCVKDEPSLREGADARRPTAPAAPSERGSAGASPSLYEGAVKFKGEAAELKCTPKFQQVTFRTALGTLTIGKDYIIGLSPTEVQLLGGSLLKGELLEKTLTVQWSLGERQIAMAEVERYQRTSAPPAVSVNVTKDGDLVPPTFGSQVALKDESIIVGDLKEKALRFRISGAGDVMIGVEKIAQVMSDGQRLEVVLKDGNTVTGELLGDYAVSLLEGTLTLRGGERLQSLTFAARGALGGIERLHPQDGSVMVFVPAGEFLMGSDDGDADEKPAHKVYLDAFWIDKYEVTNEQYAKFLNSIKRTGDHSKCFKGEPSNKDHTPRYWNDTKFNAAKQPVVSVDWYDAYAYAAWAGKRLPTEAEWEKAARGTDGRKYPWGNEWDGSRCCWSGNSNGAAKVGSFPNGASPYGAMDMAGNVWEWCADWYERYPSTSVNEMLRNPKGPATGQVRALRGGSWDLLGGYYYRAAYRNWLDPAYGSNDRGFRCAQSR